MNKREFGAELEIYACEQLKKSGCKIIQQNYLCKLGEIDIIAQDNQCLIFVEVRYRKQSIFGSAAESVNLKKQQKIIRAASLYLKSKNLTNHTHCRFDVFAIDGNLQKLDYNWIKAAFSA